MNAVVGLIEAQVRREGRIKVGVQELAGARLVGQSTHARSVAGSGPMSNDDWFWMRLPTHAIIGESDSDRVDPVRDPRGVEQREGVLLPLEGEVSGDHRWIAGVADGPQGLAGAKHLLRRRPAPGTERSRLGCPPDFVVGSLAAPPHRMSSRGVEVRGIAIVLSRSAEDDPVINDLRFRCGSGQKSAPKEEEAEPGWHNYGLATHFIPPPGSWISILFEVP